MALAKCKECNKDVSEFAEKCPHCGKNAPTLGGYWTAFQVIYFIIMLPFVIFFVGCVTFACMGFLGV